METKTLVEINNLTHLFRLTKSVAIKALSDVSFSINQGEILGIVGESGSGKSTLARCLMNIHKPYKGEIFYKGINICDKKQFAANKKMLQKNRQIIFQDSNSSLNQRMSIREILAEPLEIQKLFKTAAEREEHMRYHMSFVGLEPRFLDLYPPEISGGQRQRVSIARALEMRPELLVADEPVASLDVSIQAQIINLFKHLQEEHHFTLLFIAHDLAMVEFLCDRVGVMYHGHLVELAETKELFSNPVHAYTKALLSAIPVPDPRIERGRKILEFEGVDMTVRHDFNDIGNGHFVLQDEGVTV